MVAVRSRLWLALVLLVSCRNTVGDVPNAGVVGAEGEGEGEGEGGCPSEPVIGMIVVVKADDTQFPICDASIVITEAPFIETLASRGVYPECDYVGAIDRPGHYGVDVSAADYDPAQIDVDVLGDACGHAVLARVSIPLFPTAP